MDSFSFLKWLKNISIAKKLHFIVGIMALLIGVELVTLFFSIHTLSAVRAYIEGESLWSKAQKNAVYHLTKYGITRDEKEYNLYEKYMKIPLGDKKARIELLKEHPDYNIVRQGFLEGRNHPDDIDGMINFFRRFNKIPIINKAIVYWTEGETNTLKIIPLAEKLHQKISSNNSSYEDISQLLNQLEIVAKEIMLTEDEFSYALSEGSRWLENIILRLLFVIAVTVEITGLLLTISLSKGISKGLTEIIATAKSFAKGNLSIRAKVFSKDEIGILAQSFNQMSDGLEKGIHELQQAQKKFEGLLESAPDAIILMDKVGNIKLVNAQTERLFNYDRSELYKNKIELIIPAQFWKSSSWDRKTFTDTASTQAAGTGLNGRKRNGEEFPVEINLSPLKTEEDIYICAAIRDISERSHIKELEAKNKELEQFAYIASHDLQEPLSTIKSFVSFLEEDYKDKLDKTGAEYIGYLRESVNRMSVLITDVLEYSRIGRRGTLEKVDCNVVVKEVLKDLNSTIINSNATVKVSELPIITGYELEIRILFQNLLSNAIKFRSPGIKPLIEITAEKNHQHWHFKVKDNGIGIEEKQQSKIFVIFQRLHNAKDYEGTGIGLAQCKKIVELHNGKIWVESTPGKGSEFHFTLPFDEEILKQTST